MSLFVSPWVFFSFFFKAKHSSPLPRPPWKNKNKRQTQVSRKEKFFNFFFLPASGCTLKHIKETVSLYEALLGRVGEGAFCMIHTVSKQCHYKDLQPEHLWYNQQGWWALSVALLTYIWNVTQLVVYVFGVVAIFVSSVCLYSCISVQCFALYGASPRCCVSEGGLPERLRRRTLV